MRARQIINKLLVQMIMQEGLNDRNETKIFMPATFAQMLEKDLGIKTIKNMEFGGYRIIFGPFRTISAYNKVRNIQIVMSISGDILDEQEV